MNEAQVRLNYKDRTLALRAIGIVLLLVGVVAAFIGPVEIYCFYLFSEGGRFHYEGFGFGSFVFGNIASQIIIYYVFATLFIPLGYGHLTARRWARVLALTLLWFWLVTGIPLVIIFGLMAVTSKELPLAIALIIAVMLGLSYLLFPWQLIRFYKGRNARLTFETQDPRSYGIEQFPLQILVLCSLYLFYIIVLHVLILFNGLFPLFGSFQTGLQGIILLDISIVCQLCLLWGTLTRRIWAWWGALLFFGLATISALLTFSQASYADILSVLEFPAREIEFLDRVPIQGAHLAVVIGIPLLINLGVVILSRQHFAETAQNRHAR